MGPFSIHTEILDEVVVFSLEGVCGADGGKQLAEAVEEHLKVNRTKVVLDFSQCQILLSPAIGNLLDLSSRILDDFQGNLVFQSLNKVQIKIFSMLHLLKPGNQAATRDEALAKARGSIG